MKLILQIEVKIEAPEFNNELTPDLIDKINSIEKEVFSDYIIDSNLHALIEEHVKGGILTLEYQPQNHKYYAIVEYDVEKKLNLQVENELVRYTLGQISDGIGDNLVQIFQNRYNMEFYMEDASKPEEVLIVYR